jgi:hypothetical protein
MATTTRKIGTPDIDDGDDFLESLPEVESISKPMPPRDEENKKLKDATGRDALVRIAALVQQPEALYYRDNPQDQSKPPREFIPYRSAQGLVQYEVCFPYAQRLLSSEPYKFKLMYPDFILAPVAASNGGTELRPFFKHVAVKNINGLVQKNHLGVVNMVEDSNARKLYEEQESERKCLLLPK